MSLSLAVLHTRALAGLDAPSVTVEVHLANGLPSFTIVGLPETEVKEARDRVRAAILNSHFEFPARRVTVNLAPADLPKSSGRFDLAIAVGILVASGQVSTLILERHEYVGELSLSGALRPVRGALAFALANASAMVRRDIILPSENAEEAALVAGAVVRPALHLLDVCAYLVSPQQSALPVCTVDPEVWRDQENENDGATRYPDFSDIKGQPAARRAIEIAAAGGHSAILIGPPGTGKSMLAHRLPGILPDLTQEEALEVAVLQSVARGFEPSQWRRRPFRAPHHTASAVALAGGGSMPRPGEMSLAHRGVLFLDELPEFTRHALEVLRQPLENGYITISRAAHHLDFPARFMLVAAMNPCPCGYTGCPDRTCRCSVSDIRRYQARLSGPLLDRIDMQIQVASLPHADLREAPPGEPTRTIAMRVAACRSFQTARQGCLNAALNVSGTDRWCRADDAGETLLEMAMKKFTWSARSYHRVLRLARSIADLDQTAAAANDQDPANTGNGCKPVSAKQIGEAIQYRRLLGE